MKSTQYLAVALSTLALLEGVAAQRGGGRGKADAQNTAVKASEKANKPAGTSAKAAAATSAAAGGNNGDKGKGAATTSAAAAAAATSAAAGGKDKATGASSAAAGAASSTTAAAAGASSSAAANKAGDTKAAGSTTLNPDVIAKGSESNGNPSAGQAPSLTDNANFINFCAGKSIMNGEQVQTGSCNPIPMGDIPAKAKMVSTVITNPANGANLQANQQFKVELQTQNMVAGSFTNPNNTYYAAPQQLQDGIIVGHAHVTIQDMGANGNTPPDPTKFAFFKGIDDAGNGKGALSATVTNGLPAGNYRVCTLMSASNHQAVLMPVAQRGAQDDCIRFTVGGAGAAAAGASSSAAAGASSTAAAAAGAASSTSAAAKGAASTTAAAAKGAASTTAAAAAASSGAAKDKQAGGNKQAGGKGRGRGRQRRTAENRFVEREFIV